MCLAPCQGGKPDPECASGAWAGGSSAHSLELGDVEKYQCGPWEAGGMAATGPSLYVRYRRAEPSTLA